MNTTVRQTADVRRHSSLRLTIAAALAGAASLAIPLAPSFGQTPPPDVVVGFGPMFSAATDCFVARTDDEEPNSNVVKGQPYSAVGRSRMVTTFADGNRIVRENTVRHFRDSEGRTRMEHEFSGVGPFALSGSETIVSINDPVRREHLVLNPALKRADVLPTENFFTREWLPPGGPAVGVASTAAAPLACEVQGQERKSTSLGERIISGLRVTGTRQEYEIPAGKVGNDLPVTIRSEQWYSPELSIIVASSHTDPLVGETTYKLEQISRKEPASSLFKAPDDYERHQLPKHPGGGEHIFIAPAPAPAAGAAHGEVRMVMPR